MHAIFSVFGALADRFGAKTAKALLILSGLFCAAFAGAAASGARAPSALSAKAASPWADRARFPEPPTVSPATLDAFQKLQSQREKESFRVESPGFYFGGATVFMDSHGRLDYSELFVLTALSSVEFSAQDASARAAVLAFLRKDAARRLCAPELLREEASPAVRIHFVYVAREGGDLADVEPAPESCSAPRPATTPAIVLPH